ncbi:DUF4158 domain-containing protein [Nocardiopsis mangrovi]|uniref:DUF4158 domain-containing protein n=1 Tax=Nocardiopsis mangrovi TaxID=1179818 RepID=A0ABV9E5K8_9ACTN
MRQEWTPEEPVDAWALEEGDRKPLGNKSGATRLGFALLLKFFQIEGRVPAYAKEIPAAAVDHVASEVGVDAALFAEYPWGTRAVKYHRRQIRDHYGTRPPTEDDEEQLAAWLAATGCPVEAGRDAPAEAVVRRCRTKAVEPPSPGQVERVVTSGLRRFDQAFTAEVGRRSGPGARGSRSGCWASRAPWPWSRPTRGRWGWRPCWPRSTSSRPCGRWGIPEKPFGSVSEKFYGRGEDVPVERVVPKAWAAAVTDAATGRGERIDRFVHPHGSARHDRIMPNAPGSRGSIGRTGLVRGR